jgi:hypothetical protein
VLLLLGGLTLLVAGLTILAGRRQSRQVMAARARLQADLAGTDIRRLGGARCLGPRGGTDLVVRGTGALGLTGTQLRFVQAEDGPTIAIALDRVLGTSLTTSFRGSGLTPYHRRPVLVVEWASDGGVRRAVGWTLPEAAVWSMTIDQLVGR